MDTNEQPAPFQDRVLAGWRRAFPDLAPALDEPGTSLIEDPQRPADAWVALWPAGRRVVAEVAPSVAAAARRLLADRSPRHRLTGDELAACWPDQPTERERQHLYGVDPSRFRPAVPAPGHQVQILTEADRAAFAAFLATCSDADREEGDVDIGGSHELTVAVTEESRVVAAASMFAWRGFSDVGILTAPAARRRGAGRAAVSALCQRLVDGPRVVVYRHADDNAGSRGIARSLGLTPIGVADCARPIAR